MSEKEEILFLRSKTACREGKRLHHADDFTSPLNSQNRHLNLPGLPKTVL